MESRSNLYAQDYFPFGSVMDGRSYNNDKYRFGFNGKEEDTEGMGGGGSTYDYGFRIYNPALGRFLSVDPLTKSFPFYTPYQFAGNMPIWAIDLDGLEEYKVTHYYNQDESNFRTEIELVKKDGPLKVAYYVRFMNPDMAVENPRLVAEEGSDNYSPSDFVERLLETKEAVNYDSDDEVWKDSEYKSKVDYFNEVNKEREAKGKAKEKVHFNFVEDKTPEEILAYDEVTLETCKYYWNNFSDDALEGKTDEQKKQDLNAGIGCVRSATRNSRVILDVVVTSEVTKKKWEEQLSSLGFREVNIAVVKAGEKATRDDGQEVVMTDGNAVVGARTVETKKKTAKIKKNANGVANDIEK